MNKQKIRRIIKALVIILLVYVVFFVYSNLDLSKKREYVFYDNLSVNNNIINYDSKIIEGTEPIFYGKGEKAVLLLHGMGGTPIELKELAEYLASKNITVLVPLLPSQGRSYNELKKLNRTEAYDFSLKCLNILKRDYDEVYVGGLSTGGSLSLKIAENENVSGILSFASPIVYGSNFLGDSTLPIFRSLNFLTPNLRRIEYGLAKNQSIKEILPSFDRLPIQVLIQGELLKKETIANIKKINQPIVIFQSISDNRAAPSSAQYIYDNVNSSKKYLVWFNNSGHVITMDYDKEELFEESYRFLVNN